MKSKIDVLTALINKAQTYLEHIIIEDHLALIDGGGNIKYWMEQVIENIENQITISFITNVRLNTYRYRNNPFIFYLPLEELTLPDSIGFLRTLSRQKNIPFDNEGIDKVANVLTGYPPQVIYCVEEALEHGISYITENQYLISDMPKISSGKMLELVIEEDSKDKYYGFLVLLAQFGSTPLGIIDIVTKKDNDYS